MVAEDHLGLQLEGLSGRLQQRDAQGHADCNDYSFAELEATFSQYFRLENRRFDSSVSSCDRKMAGFLPCSSLFKVKNGRGQSVVGLVQKTCGVNSDIVGL